MRVDIFRLNMLGRWRYLTQARALDYNRYGLGVVAAVKLAPGTDVQLDLHAPGMILRRVSAQVVSCERCGQGYRLGLRTYDTLQDLLAGENMQLRFLAGMETALAP
ncbi:MAG: PilZ domain-containing protein [Alcanivorax sp.]|nr:PilZ domain-containing protein [Alcanivorax sp.]